jgi:transmembrane sensor
VTDPNESFAPLEEGVLDVAADWLVRLNDSTASAADFEEWHRWLSADPRHRQASGKLEATWQLAFQAAASHPSQAALAADRYRVEEPIGSWVGRRRRMQRRHWIAATAAMLLAALGVGAWWSRQPVVIQTMTAEQRIERLPDGSRLTVGPRTRVSYRFTDASRGLTLSDGEVYFEVKKDPERPFVVDTERGRIVAVGTAFSVDSMLDRLNVTVTEGTVRIEAGANETPPGDATAPGTVLVTAGQRYVVTASGARVSTLPGPTEHASWRDGRLAYYDEPLSAVIADLNRYSADRIDITEPALRELQFTGTVFPDDLTDWLTSLPDAFPVRVTRREHEWLIVPGSASSNSSVVTTR